MQIAVPCSQDNMKKIMDEDEELESYLADIEDVVNGRMVDMNHAEYMYKVIDAVCELEESLEWIHRNDVELRKAINGRSIKELDEMICSIKRMKSKIDSYFEE